MERVQNKRDEAEEIEMHRAGRAPAAHENEEPDEEVEKSEYAEIVLDQGRFFGRNRDQLDVKCFPATLDPVARFLPNAQPPQDLGDLRGAVNFSVVQGM